MAPLAYNRNTTLIEINWLLFIIASVAVILTPGQDLLLVMSRSMTQGAAAGVATAAGVSSGLMVHTLLATLGIGAIVMASQWLYLTMKFIGAAYLVYLAVSLLRASGTAVLAEASERRSLRKLYVDGAISNVANPKIAIFYFAFLPQFVSAQSASMTLAVFMLGASFALLTFLIKAPVGYFSGHLSLWFRQHPRYLTGVYRLSGCMLLGLGAKLVLDERSRL